MVFVVIPENISGSFYSTGALNLKEQYDITVKKPEILTEPPASDVNSSAATGLFHQRAAHLNFYCAKATPALPLP
jgi:hypothetical protein